MSFNPQIPDWGKNLSANNLKKLLSYHNWLSNTAIKTGLISPKPQQFIWDEFVIHSLYFYKIILDLKLPSSDIYDLGTGAGIPGIPVGIVSDKRVNLVDIKQKRIFELERFLSAHKYLNIKAVKGDAELFLKNEHNATFLMRCFIPKSDLIKKINKYKSINNNNTFIVSSKSSSANFSSEAFHVKQNRFLINKDAYRFIDVITVK
jgi:16S rRNA G527 N7-methylase RsmG